MKTSIEVLEFLSVKMSITNENIVLNFILVAQFDEKNID